MKNNLLILIAITALVCGVNVKASIFDDEAKILNDFKQKYNDSQSDIIFLMDVSGSVSNYGFSSEKIFVDNLLNEFSVAPYSTRVAVITFGKNVKTDINYIDIDPTSLTHQKCEFKPRFQHNVVHRYAPATNMKDAFQRSSDLLQTAMNNNHRRSNVHTVTIMITDGYWNTGDPRANANKLKNTYGVDVITVGVDGYSQWQLEALATSKDLVLGFSTFTQFRELALFIRGDAHDMIFMEVDSNKCTSSNGCDTKAFCGCGTVSGIYQCVCKQGYYGSGIRNYCFPCMRGTYKQWPTPSQCLPCPAHSTTESEGSILINQCKCFTGFEGDPSRDIACTAVECEKLVAPINGGFLAACGNVYDSVCEFQCNSGYILVGSSSRRCQSDKIWSGTAVQCQTITCAVLPAQAYGTKTCTGKGYEYGDTCTFTCDVGYERKGSATRSCQADGQWSGQQTTCEARMCPALRQLAFGTIEPVDCATTPQPYQRGCIMQCVVGYVMTGDSPLICGADGTWQGTFPKCEDKQPPIITCPTDVTGETDPGRPTRTVTWNDPVVSDNSELHDPNAAPTVVRTPNNIASPHEFPIGTTHITYTATDRSNNAQSCIFTVTVEDKEPPTIYCPQNQEVKNKGDSVTVKVYWPPPTYRDNSGKNVTVFTESINGSNFEVGSYQIKYEARDHVGNQASCTFIIVVSSVKCKPYDPPINGLVSCQFDNLYGGDLCTPSCELNREFARIPAQYYVCLNAGTWVVFDNRPYVTQEMPWPDCTEEYIPGAARKGMEWQYFVGDCSDPAVQQQAKQNFIIGFNEIFGAGDPNYCQREKICQLENIRVTCGRTQRRRRKRAVQAVITIELDVLVNTQNSDFAAAKSSLEGNVTKAMSSSSMKTIQVSDSQTMSLNTVTDTPTVGVCIDGSVYGLNQGLDKTGDHSQRCQNCPPGTFFDLSIGNCTECPLNTYNTYTGQVGQCTVCPQKTYTLAAGSKNITQCLAACQPGEFSPTGLANCEACPINSYQSLLRQTACTNCPGSSVTLAEGTKSISGCGMSCAPGTYSQTGVEPCLPCPRGRYQPTIKQTSCLLCGSGTTTYGEGASSLGQCIDIQDCASNPCNNDAQCVESAEGYKCVCQPGFTGVNCDMEEDECVSSPCAEGATCVDKVNEYLCLCQPGYSGVHCDVKESSCKSDECASGSTCVDTPEGHNCICPDGYEGQFCESKINDCKSSPCQNGGTCLNEFNSYKCTCPTGFSGIQCERNDNGCLPDSCLNGAKCTDTSNGHECSCAAGFAGSQCEVNINECSSTPCQNNGHCVDQTNGYKCYCKPSFKGTNCETEISTDFDMEFERELGRGSSIVEMRQELRAFTVAFWMKVGQDQLDPGTPISYAVQDGGKLVDNALVIHDYNGFNIWVNGQKAATNVAANDGKWHHVALTWKSSTGGWNVYKDGSKVRENDVTAGAFQKGQVIAAGGSFVLGQEQDQVAQNFSANEAFIGKMSQMNVWSYELPAQDIADMARHADNFIGNVVAWSDFYNAADVGIKKTKPSVARTENKCWTNWLNGDSPTTGGGDTETRAGACAGPGPFDCQDVEGRSMPDLELNLTSTCSDSGITCLNSDQRVGRSCPDFKVRFVCTCPANSACNSDPCGAHGTCETLPVGYKCNCKAGYEGRHCETALNCPSAGIIAHGSSSGSLAIGGKMTISCNIGFKASSTATLNCVGGKWDAPVPQCIDVDECTAGAGQASCEQSCVNTLGSYKCECQAGYKLNSDGSCTDIDECKANNGNCQQSCHNSVGSFRCTCAEGYNLMADGRSCADNNECSSNGGLGPCEQICVNTLLGSQCLCNPGYTLNGDGKTCKASSCPAISSLANGILDPASPATTVDSNVRFECNVGYILRGASTRTCLADRTWSGKEPRCDVVNCILPGDLQDGTRSTAANSYNTVVTYTCNSGFRLVGSATRTCQADGSWSGEHPRCIAADCPEPAVPANGELIGFQRKNGDTIRFECVVGYKLVGQSYAICEEGAWNSPTPSCNLINCGAPPAIPNGQIHGSDFSYNAKVTFSCNAANFKLSGSQERTCQADGTWSGTQPVCLENSCGNPGTPANGIKVGESYLYHDIVSFQCNEGYQLVGSKTRTCQTDNNWDGTQPTCQLISCGDPGTPSNGERLGSELTYGKTIIYDCNPGYQLSGSRSRTCQLDGTWSGSVAQCTASACGSNLVGPSGSFSSPNNPNSYPDNAYCRWKISVPSGKKVMVTFNTFKTQKDNDVVEIYDGVSKQLITKLSGVYSKAVSFTSENNAIDVRFVSDGSQNSEGFSASYQQVTCGGILTGLEQTVMSPNYPSDYPNSVTCVWSLNIGKAFQLEFEAFHTESGYDLLQGYSSLSSFTQNDLIFDIDGERFALQPIQALAGQMYLKFTSNYVRTAPGFKATTKKYQVIVGK